MKKGEMGGSPPSLWGDSGDPSALSPAACAPCALTGADGGVGWGGGGRAGYGEEPPRSSASAPQQGLGVVSRGAAGTGGAFHPLLRARSPLPPPPLPPSPPPPSRSPLHFELKAPHLALSPTGLQCCCFKAQSSAWLFFLQSRPLGTLSTGQPQEGSAAHGVGSGRKGRATPTAPAAAWGKLNRDIT